MQEKGENKSFLQKDIEVYLGGEWKPIPNALLPISVVNQLNNLTSGGLAIADEDSEEIFIRYPQNNP
jgi:hypothetical protein